MNLQINKKMLFYGSCLALITTGMTFGIRAGVLKGLGENFSIGEEQLGFTNFMWFLGFPISMILGGMFYHNIKPANIMRIAFVAHTLGIILTIYAQSYETLLISTLFLGFGNGCTEAACNPMIADMYPADKVDKMLNRFHMWFPGGIILGSLVSEFMTSAGLGWEAQTWTLMLPTIAYAVLFYGQLFPTPKIAEAASLGNNFKGMLSPVFLFLFCCMALTAVSEFIPNQWVGIIMEKSGASPMLILALTAGIMLVGRFFAGPIVNAMGQSGTLIFSAVFTTIGIYMFSTVTGNMAYLAAVFFAIGVCYFWPTMVGAAAKRAPLSGALGLSIIGGVGMFSTSIFQPITGRWIESSRALIAPGKAAEALTDLESLAVGQMTLQKIIIFPVILIVLFTFYHFWQKKVDANLALKEKV